MTAQLVNGLPAHGTNGVNGNATEVANSTPSHPAFDSIPDVIEAFGMFYAHDHPLYPSSPFATQKNSLSSHR